jgi:hypothetical protein
MEQGSRLATLLKSLKIVRRDSQRSGKSMNEGNWKRPEWPEFIFNLNLPYGLEGKQPMNDTNDKITCDSIILFLYPFIYSMIM